MSNDDEFSHNAQDHSTILTGEGWIVYKLRMVLNSEAPQKLGSFGPGSMLRIVGFSPEAHLQDFLIRLFEIGFLLGEELEILHDAPLGRDPISVRIKGGVYALRREDANLVLVSPLAAAC